MKPVNLVGNKYGRLTVLNIHQKQSKENKYIKKYICLCECGNTTVALHSNLRKGNTSSCGCLSEERWLNEVTKHGDYGSVEYHAWLAMKQRCYDKNIKGYKYWGGRGITVCDEWLNDYAKFLKDMGRRPYEKYSLDRIDNDKGYSPGNCKWSSRSEQNKNRRPKI